MPSPTLVIGVGGTGLRVLLRTKERFVEAYDEMPGDVILLELDTDPYQGPDRDNFNGVTLTARGDKVDGREVLDDAAEFYWVYTQNNDEKISTILDKKEEEWQWVDKRRMNRTITAPGAESINSGARTVRPIGKAALYMDYRRVYEVIQKRINLLVSLINRTSSEEGAGELVADRHGQIKNTGQIFVTASVAGGSGAGLVLDVLRMIEHIRKSTTDLPVTVSCLLVGGSCFVKTNDGQRTLSNTYAALRELDRFGAIAGKMITKAVPSVIIAPAPVGRMQSAIGPADNIYLFDRPDRFGRTRKLDQYGEVFLNQVITPSIADYIVAMTDKKFTPKFKSLDADLGENCKKGPNGEKGHFPYMSAGIHTLIYPERDVRWSAGFKLLNQIWDDYMVRSKVTEQHHNQGNDLQPITANLWGKSEAGVNLADLTPYNFSAIGFQRETVCGKTANNGFIQNVVASAEKGEISLPSKYPNFLSFFTGGRTMLARVWALVGIPSTSRESFEQFQARAIKVEEWFNKQIEDLDKANNRNGTEDWRKKNWGTGALGAENLAEGTWLRYLENEPMVRGHKGDFSSVLISVVEEILNDKDENGRILPYRLEYAHRVLDKLDKEIGIWLYAKEKNARSLLERYFDTETDKANDKREKLKGLDAGKNFDAFKRALIEYAKARRELFALELLKLLCNDLKNTIKLLSKDLSDWREWFRGAGVKIKQRQSEHEENRIMKQGKEDDDAQNGIRVRTYVTKKKLEEDLFKLYQEPACDMFRKVIFWSRNGEGGFFLREAVFSKIMPDLSDEPTADELDELRKKITLSPSDAAERAIMWACTKLGNPDRQDDAAQPPLRKLASPGEVEMSVQIAKYFGQRNPQTAITILTNESNIASLCPIKEWPAKKLYFLSCVPRISSKPEITEEFYANLFTGIHNAASPTRFTDRSIIHDKAENPRHAFAIELAVGFRLQDRNDYDTYLETYLADNAAMNALHCFSEEANAVSSYELQINTEKQPGETRTLYQNQVFNGKIQLDPVVVDVLGNQKRLEQFVKARVLGLIDTGVNGDLYLYPGLPNGNYRLSKMSDTEDRLNILSDLVYDDGRLATISADKQIPNRMRLFYALRTFTLFERCLDDSNRIINYKIVDEKIEEELKNWSPDELKLAYEGLINNYLSFYDDYGNNTRDNLTILAHLGLVLAQVSHSQLNNH